MHYAWVTTKHTERRAHSTRTTEHHRDTTITKAIKKINCTITKKREGKDLKGQFGCLSEN